MKLTLGHNGYAGEGKFKDLQLNITEDDPMTTLYCKPCENNGQHVNLEVIEERKHSSILSCPICNMIIEYHKEVE